MPRLHSTSPSRCLSSRQRHSASSKGMNSPDIVIIGSGMGGATIAAGLAGSGAKVTILEKGERLLDSPETRDARAIFQRGHFRPRESRLDAGGKPFTPGNYHVVGGNTKFYGAVLFRYRREDF